MSAVTSLDGDRAVAPTPFWFAGAALGLLFVRPLGGLAGGLPIPLPGIWEQAVLLFLAGVGCIAASPWKGPAALFLTAAAVNILSQAVHLPGGLPWLILLMVVEAAVPELVPIGWCLLWAVLPAFAAELLGEPLAPVLQLLLTVFCGIMAWRTGFDRWQRPPEKALSGFFLLVGLACGATFVLVRPPQPGPFDPHSTRVIIDERAGSSESARTDAPRENGHHILYDILSEAGVQVFLATESAPLPVAGSDIVRIVILPDRPLAQGLAEEWLRGVHAGEGLLVILDHTDMDGAAGRLTPLLGRLGLTDGFSTIAWPGVPAPACGISGCLGRIDGYPGTGGALRPPPHWLPSSLSLAGPHPLAWIDHAVEAICGSPAAPLNAQMDRAGLVQAGSRPVWTGAWGEFGNGRWAVLADSSWFQNTQIAQNIPFLHRLLALLATGPDPFRPWIPPLALALALLGLARRYRIAGKPALPAGLILGLALSLWAERQVAPPHALLPQRPQASLALPSSGLHQLTARQSSSFDTNLDTLCELLLTNGWLPSILSPKAQPDGNARLWILPPSDLPPSPVLLKRIEAQTAKGANLLLWVDGTAQTGQTLLRRFGFDAPTDITARLPWATNTLGLADRALPGPHRLLASASLPAGIATAPLWSDLPYPLLGGDAWFCRSDGRPVVASRSFGKGLVIAITDPLFFTNGALHVPGTLDDPVKRAFVGDLLAFLLPRSTAIPSGEAKR